MALYFVGTAGLAAALTLVFLGMRAVMDVGGYCAEGGPYVIQTHCPHGVPLVMMLAFLGGFGSAGLMANRGTRLGPRYVSALYLAWPALFLSLGWNFLQYGLNPPGGGGDAWGWLICAVVFGVMGGAPLLVGIAGVPRISLGVLASDAVGWAALMVAVVVVGAAIGWLAFGFLTG